MYIRSRKISLIRFDSVIASANASFTGGLLIPVWNWRLEFFACFSTRIVNGQVLINVVISKHANYILLLNVLMELAVRTVR